MWDVRIHGHVMAEGCPTAPLDAAHWREAQGLPEGDTARVNTRLGDWTCREVCEALARTSVDVMCEGETIPPQTIVQALSRVAEGAIALVRAVEAAQAAARARAAADRAEECAAREAALRAWIADERAPRPWCGDGSDMVRWGERTVIERMGCRLYGVPVDAALIAEALACYDQRAAAREARAEEQKRADAARQAVERSEKLHRLAPVVAEHGTDVQRRKFAAGLMAVGEAVEVLRAATEARMAAAGYASVEEDRPVRAPNVAHDEDDCQGEIEYIGDEPVQSLPDVQFVRAEALRAVLPDGATVEYRAYTERCEACEATARVWYARFRYTAIGFAFVRDVSLMP